MRALGQVRHLGVEIVIDDASVDARYNASTDLPIFNLKTPTIIAVSSSQESVLCPCAAAARSALGALASTHPILFARSPSSVSSTSRVTREWSRFRSCTRGPRCCLACWRWC